ncbi:MAG TPA: beta-ketoacyl-[acyl-carrier-protein] synthase family protein [Planctomycetota bacterium]
MTRVVVTGLGCATALGFGPDDHIPALKAGRSAQAPITRFDTAGFKTSTGGQCDEARLEGLLLERFPARALARLDVDTRLLLWATSEALGDLRVEGMPALLGTTLEGIWQGEQWYAEGLKRGTSKARPRRLLQATSGGQFATLAELLGMSIEPLCVSNACATGVSAIGRLYRRIRRGACEAGLAGGYDTLGRFIHLGFDSLGALTSKVCAPFDKNRSGFFIGDGAAVLLLESLESARRRKSRILAELVGYGESVDSHHATHPDPEGRGLTRAIRQAVEGVEGEIDYINAHGTATPANDAAESKGILAALGDRKIPTSSTKALVGHTLGAAGAVEQAFCVWALERGFRPVQANLSEQDPACPLTLVRDPAGAPTLAMNTSLGFGGANAVLLARRWEDVG